MPEQDDVLRRDTTQFGHFDFFPVVVRCFFWSWRLEWLGLNFMVEHILVFLPAVWCSWSEDRDAAVFCMGIIAHAQQCMAGHGLFFFVLQSLMISRARHWIGIGQSPGAKKTIVRTQWNKRESNKTLSTCKFFVSTSFFCQVIIKRMRLIKTDCPFQLDGSKSAHWPHNRDIVCTVMNI